MEPPEVFHFADFLTPEMCQKVRSTLYTLKDHWILRAPKGVPFYTLGAAGYLDASNKDYTNYHKLAAKQNRILCDHFSELYDRLNDCITDYTGNPSVLALDQAIPGFHIFQYHSVFEKPIAKIHFDNQYRDIPWNHEKIDYKHPLSFTASIILPKAGAGLLWWEITPEDLKGLNKDERKALRDHAERHYLPYKEGKILIHNGLTLHQIAPAEHMQPDDERITLQGHALFCDGAWRLHW